MKTAIYISGLTVFLFMIIGFYGILMEYPGKPFYFIFALVFFALVFLPLVIAEKHRYKRKMESINDRDKVGGKKEFVGKKGASKTSGWNMNNSPFRERKSGLIWGGGNIKASGASRGSGRSFLK